MKIFSMTGYASLQTQTALGQFNFELRSVNHRYFELQVKADEQLRSFEPWVRELLASKISRGKVECRLSLNRTHTEAAKAEIDPAALDKLLQMQQTVLQKSPQSTILTVRDILSWPGVIPDSPADLVEIEQVFKQAMQTLLENLLQHRMREGTKLAEFMLDKNQQIAQALGRLPPLMHSAMDSYQAKLVAKLKDAADTLDTDRLQQEIVYFAQRVDVEEEIARLGVHTAELKTILEQGGAVGKRLDFLMQEFNREANTLASKSISPEITQIALSFKVLIEQMREQVQNLE
mgnify:FL=1